jgi:hypothetical protein
MQEPGWDVSEGVQKEILWAKKGKKYVYLTNPENPAPTIHHICVHYPGGPMGDPKLRQRRKNAQKLCLDLQEGLLSQDDWRALIALGPQTTKKRYT